MKDDAPSPAEARNKNRPPCGHPFWMPARGPDIMYWENTKQKALIYSVVRSSGAESPGRRRNGGLRESRHNSRTGCR